MPTLPCPAKINLFLEVTGKRPDGFHDIESVFLAIDLCDTLHAELSSGRENTVTTDDPGVPSGPENLVIRAADALRRRRGDKPGIAFRLQKRIPMGGGLGGGSSNAAAALRLANELWECGLSTAELAAIGAEIGSDVPFFLYGGCCLCRGRGELVEPLRDMPRDLRIGLALPSLHSDTAAAYRGLRLHERSGIVKPDAFLAAMRAGDTGAMAAAAFNRFEETVFAALPELARLHAELQELLGVPVRMSGSGAGLWWLMEENPDHRVEEWAAANRVKLRHRS